MNNRLFTDITGMFEPVDIKANKIKALICYIWILFLIPVIDGTNSRYVKFHANQGLILTAAEFVIGIVMMLLPQFFIIKLLARVIEAAFFFARIYGVYTVATGKAVEFPYFDKIKIIK